MAFYFPDLDERTRQLMLEEARYDEARNVLQISPYLSGQGVRDFPELLKEAIRHGDEETLAAELDRFRRVTRTSHRQRPKGGYSVVTVPSNAAAMMAEDAFNRYYIRALCRRALEEGIEELIVYRAKPVETPRARSEAIIESTVEPLALLEDLRDHPGEEPELGIPGGPNSGISVRLP